MVKIQLSQMPMAKLTAQFTLQEFLGATILNKVDES